MTKLTVKQMISNEAATHPKGYLTELADVAGYTGQNKGSNFNKVLTDEKKEFDSFQGIMNVLDSIWKENSLEKMVQYSTEVDPKKKTARNFLEYLATARQFEAFNNLLDKMDSCTNKEANEWAKIYRLQYKYEVARTFDDYNELLKLINQLNVTITELKVYKKMLLCYCFDQMSDYTMTRVLSKEISHEIQLIENDYIKEMYTIRFNEVMSYIHLRVYNNPEAARECADKIISSNAKLSFKGFAYYIKGFSYLFTSFENTVLYLNKSIEIYEKLNRNHDVEKVKEELEMALILWNKIEDSKCISVKNQLLFEIKAGKIVNLDQLNEVTEPEFKLYFEGCITNNINKLFQSLIKFIKKNDMFLANLSKIELLKNGYDEETIEDMMTINVPERG